MAKQPQAVEPQAPATQLLPWHNAIWQTLEKQITDNRFPSAQLITGSKGSGKKQLIQLLSKRLLCQQPTGDKPCGNCGSCHWFEGQTHPDYYWVGPEGKSETIKVDAIRELCTSLRLTSHAGGVKLGVIYQAESMNLNAANSLLKSLEEPAGNTIFILVSHEPGSLPITIRSRCQTIALETVDNQLASQWLQSKGVKQVADYLAAAQGAPIQAWHMAQGNRLQEQASVFKEFKTALSGNVDLVGLAQQWQKKDLKQLYAWLLAWVRDLIKLKLNITQGTLNNPELLTEYRTLNKKLDLTLLFAGHEQLLKAIQLLNTSMNKQLALESLLVHFRNTGNTKSS